MAALMSSCWARIISMASAVSCCRRPCRKSPRFLDAPRPRLLWLCELLLSWACSILTLRHVTVRKSPCVLA